MDILSLANSTTLTAASARTSTKLAQSVQKAAQDNAQKKVQAIADKYSQQINAVKLSATNFDKIDLSITKASNALQSSLTDIEQIDTALLNADSAVSNIANDSAAAATTYDANLATISSLANDPSSTNLLGTLQRGGNYTPNTVSYLDQNGRQVTVQGTYLGSDYKINQADGSFFLQTGVQYVKQYNAYPNGAVGYGFSTTTENTQVNGSYSDSNLSVTTGLPLAASGQKTYTGTVSRFGLQVLGAWLYNNFATPADQARAHADIAAARTTLALTKANLQTALSSAQNSQTKARENKSNIDAKVSALQAQAQVDEQKISTDAQRQFSVIQSNLAQAGIDMSGQSNPFGTYSSSAIFTALAAQNSVAKPGQKLTLAQAQKQALAVNTDASATSLLDGSINLLA